MAELITEKPKSVEKQPVARQADLQIGSIGHQTASGASAGAGAPPLDGAAVKRIQSDPQHALRSDMLALQRAVGNRAVAALVRGESKDVAIQAKLEVGPINDAYEQEADRVARMVTSGIAQRKPAANVKSKDDEGDDDAPLSSPGPAANIKRMVQRKKAESSEGGVRADGSFTTDANVHSRIRRMEGGGRPLPDTVRREMEPRFGADFSGVRIHTSSEAVQLNRDIGARAFTHGSHIAFNSGNFNPNSHDGRHLLAHELTHTIQQTGARPLQRSPEKPSVQRSPQGTIQRGVWDSVKNFFSRKKAAPVAPVISDPIQQTPQELQEAARLKADAAATLAAQLYGTAKENADKMLAGHKSVDPEMNEAGQKGRLEVAKKAISGMKAGDEALKEFVKKYKGEIGLLDLNVQHNLAAILTNGEQIKIGRGNAMALAWQSHTLAEETDQLVAQLKVQTDSARMKERGDTEVAFKRSGMEGRTFGYSARSTAAAEKAASDAVLELAEIKSKVQGYFLYLDADRKMLQKYTASMAAEISAKHGSQAVLRAMGSAIARASAPSDPGTLTNEQAFELAGGQGGMERQEGEQEDELLQGDDSPEARQSRLLQASMQMVHGKKHGEKMVQKAQSLNKDSQGKAPEETGKLAKDEKAFAKKVKRLELRHMFLIKAEKRVADAKTGSDQVEKLYNEAHSLYEVTDTLRKSSDQSEQTIGQATRAAGDARAKVAQAAVVMAKLRKHKEDVYAESQKYEKQVGPRAMSATKRRLKKTVGLVSGAGMRALTAGMYRIEAEDENGGYTVGFKSRSILDDIIKKHYELKILLRGINGKPVQGLGGKHGARAYAVFKVISFGLQIIRDIAAAVALWVTLVTAGAGAPVGAIFASIALYSGLAKAAIDLMLLIWSAVGLGNTNDPTSRMILRGENTRQGIAFAEGAFAGASAGLVMGLSGNTGLLTGQMQTTAFGEAPSGGGSDSRMFGAIDNNWSQNVGGTEIYYGGLLRTGANVGVGPALPALGGIGTNVGVNVLSPYVRHANIETKKHDELLDKVRNAKRAIRVVSNPAREAFLKLSDFAQSKKKLRENKFISILPDLSKTIEEMGSTVQQTPETPPPPFSEEQHNSGGGGPQVQDEPPPVFSE